MNVCFDCLLAVFLKGNLNWSCLFTVTAWDVVVQCFEIILLLHCFARYRSQGSRVK